MLSTAHNWIYIHVPKTGGNSVQEVLLPFSDDQKVVGEFRDGVDTFGIAGNVTPTKHATLSDYGQVLGDLSRYLIIASIRHPVERSVSYYYSPFRWMRQRSDGSWWQSPPHWNLEEFLTMLPDIRPMTEYLTIAGSVSPRLKLLRFENLAGDFSNLVKTLNLPVSGVLPQRNRTADLANLARIALSDAKVRSAVRIAHAQDFEAFGYAL